jgi:hypothetical protein
MSRSASSSERFFIGALLHRSASSSERFFIGALLHRSASKRSTNVDIVESKMQPAAYVNLCEDATFVSMATGGVQTHVISPKKQWGMGLNLAELVVGMKMSSGAGCGVTIKFQWSLDGSKWMTVGTALIPEKTADGDYVGLTASASELLPFVRVIAEVRNPSGADQKSVSLSVWAYYKFRV